MWLFLIYILYIQLQLIYKIYIIIYIDISSYWNINNYSLTVNLKFNLLLVYQEVHAIN